MTRQQFEKTIELVKTGHLVTMHSDFVDGFCTVYEHGGQWTIESHVMDSQPLIDVPWNKLSFFKRVVVD